VLSLFLEQPTSFRIGTSLIDELRTGEWGRVRIATAWIRRSGSALLRPALSDFIRQGGRVEIVAGLEFGQTSVEGLSDFVDLQTDGGLELYVYHDEARSVFHPKVFLFDDGEDGRLYVGSSNITGGGLYTNVEAFLFSDAPLVASPVREASLCLESWMDIESPFVQRVDIEILNELQRSGYIGTESLLRRNQRAAAKSRTDDNGKELFGRSSVVPPEFPRTPKSGSSLSQPIGASGQVLIMRVRPSRGTQIQLPFRLWEDPFFANVSSVISSHDGTERGIHTAKAHGKRNTAKVEMPETRGTVIPIVRFEHTPLGLMYRVFDGSSGIGAVLLGRLHGGLQVSPQITYRSISNLSQASLWQFV